MQGNLLETGRHAIESARTIAVRSLLIGGMVAGSSLAIVETMPAGAATDNSIPGVEVNHGCNSFNQGGYEVDNHTGAQLTGAIEDLTTGTVAHNLNIVPNDSDSGLLDPALEDHNLQVQTNKGNSKSWVNDCQPNASTTTTAGPTSTTEARPTTTRGTGNLSSTTVAPKVTTTTVKGSLRPPQSTVLPKAAPAVPQKGSANFTG